MRRGDAKKIRASVKEHDGLPAGEAEDTTQSAAEWKLWHILKDRQEVKKGKKKLSERAAFNQDNKPNGATPKRASARPISQNRDRRSLS